MISFYDVNIQYNLEELEKEFLNQSKIWKIRFYWQWRIFTPS
jgi:hypothetical protein